MKKLSIFVDESGSFGESNHNNQIYIVVFVFNNEGDNVNNLLVKMKNVFSHVGRDITYFPGGPIIRREDEYKYLEINQRRKLFNIMSNFVNHLDFIYTTIKIERKHIDNNKILSDLLKQEIIKILQNNLEQFQNFDLLEFFLITDKSNLQRC